MRDHITELSCLLACLWPQAIADASENRKETFTEQLQEKFPTVVQVSYEVSS